MAAPLPASPSWESTGVTTTDPLRWDPGPPREPDPEHRDSPTSGLIGTSAALRPAPKHTPHSVLAPLENAHSTCTPHMHTHAHITHSSTHAQPPTPTHSHTRTHTQGSSPGPPQISLYTQRVEASCLSPLQSLGCALRGRRGQLRPIPAFRATGTPLGACRAPHQPRHRPPCPEGRDGLSSEDSGARPPIVLLPERSGGPPPPEGT